MIFAIADWLRVHPTELFLVAYGMGIITGLLLVISLTQREYEREGKDNAALRELLATARPLLVYLDGVHHDRNAKAIVAAIDAALKDKPHD